MCTADDDNFSDDKEEFAPEVGDRISVFCPEDKMFCNGIVHSAEENSDINSHHDKGDKECQYTIHETCNFNLSWAVW